MKLYTQVIDNYGKEVLELGLGLLIQECESYLCPAYKEINPAHYNKLDRFHREAKAVKETLEKLEPIKKDMVI